MGCGVITGSPSKLQTVDGSRPWSIAACMSFSVLMLVVPGSFTFACMSSGVRGTETYAVSVVIRCNRTETENVLAIAVNDTPRTPKVCRTYGAGILFDPVPSANPSRAQGKRAGLVSSAPMAFRNRQGARYIVPLLGEKERRVRERPKCMSSTLGPRSHSKDGGRRTARV